MTRCYFLVFIVVFITSCTTNNKPLAQHQKQSSPIACSKDGCSGLYAGPEFINGSDIAHQFSNAMSAAVGDKLKDLYKKGRYTKVNFEHIVMTTEGMNSGQVEYYLNVPFVTVNSKCEAYTSFDHVGGWNHTPALKSRREQLRSLLIAGHELEMSQLKTTPEGLQEYWFQWKHKEIQLECR